MKHALYRKVIILEGEYEDCVGIIVGYSTKYATPNYELDIVIPEVHTPKYIWEFECNISPITESIYIELLNKKYNEIENLKTKLRKYEL